MHSTFSDAAAAVAPSLYTETGRRMSDIRGYAVVSVDVTAPVTSIAPHSNRHLLDAAEERRFSGAESPTDVSATAGLRRMSFCHSGDTFTTNTVHAQYVGGEPIAVAYHLSPALSQLHPSHHHHHASISSAATPTNSSPSASPAQPFSHVSAAYFSKPTHSHSSSLSHSPPISHSRHSSASTHASASSTGCVPNVGGGAFFPTMPPRSPALKQTSQTARVMGPSPTQLPEQQGDLDRGISAPELVEPPTFVSHTSSSSSAFYAHPQTPMASQPHPHFAHSSYVHQPPHQLPIQLSNQQVQPAASSHHSRTYSGTYLQQQPLPLHSFSRPQFSREGSFDREAMAMSSQTVSAASSRPLSACPSSACSSSTPSSRTSPTLRQGALSASAAIGGGGGGGRTRLDHVAVPTTSIAKENSSKTHIVGPALVAPTPSEGSPRDLLVEESSSPLIPGGSAFELHRAPDSTDSASRMLGPLQTAPGSCNSQGSQGSAASLGTLAAAVEREHLSTTHSPHADELVSPGTSFSSSSQLSARERNARYKRGRSVLEDAEVGGGEAANTQLKLSATSAASSAQGAQQAAAAAAAQAALVAQASVQMQLSAPPVLTRSLSAPPVATTSFAYAPATAAAAASSTYAVAPPPAAVAAAPAAAPPATVSLAPNTPKRQALISVLSCVLTQLFSNPNDRLPQDPRMLTRFHTERMPSISVGKYLERIAYYSECSDEALVMAFIHISRISHNKPGFNLNALSIHRLLLTSIMVTVKFMDDQYYNNSFYAKIGGVAVREINHLEVDLLELIQFELYIDTQVFIRFYEELRNPVLHPNLINLNLDEIDNPPQI